MRMIRLLSISAAKHSEPERNFFYIFAKAVSLSLSFSFKLSQTLILCDATSAFRSSHDDRIGNGEYNGNGNDDDGNDDTFENNNTNCHVNEFSELETNSLRLHELILRTNFDGFEPISLRGFSPSEQ